MPAREEGCRLYLVTPPALEPRAFADTLARALDAGDVAALQLRLKDVDDDAVRRAIDVLRPVAQSRDVAFLLNDRAELAAQTGCDGAHLGQEDGDHAAARKLLGNGMLGISCQNSRHLAMRAGELGADYVAFGAFFPTSTKAVTELADVEVLEWWSSIFEVPCVAIGGINPENCGPLVRAGADFLAVVSAVWNHPEGAGAGVRAMNAAIAAA
ncbi:thiamine phosphate synthase [Roseomonas haemaphysalidis]|uniref:Thiamine-phosphate synthase n=1 Tax=Roseomonas haemaphysalidis TaxID=2768162 RepID=A0ABS3KQB1_9PROT|nr:thiamine phosphate synthase [Roseomonas haemaphysalidis]MBO1079666.1 thiamine phosphate synthase [Roseomonas haemaphysalidis]